MEALANAHPGTGWDYIPYGDVSWFIYGSGGIGGFGSLCGVPNGCCVVLNMVGLQGLAKHVMGYYCETEFPTSEVWDLYDAGGWELPDGVPEPIPDYDVLAKTTSYSPLCHVSISKWCDAAGILMTAKDDLGRNYKKDRCAKITADMAAFTAELINNQTTTSYSYVIPADTDTCISCHNTTADSVLPAQQGTMECGGCHTDDAVIISSQHGTGQGKW